MTPTDPRVSRELADYHAVIAVDIKDFTSNTDTGNWLLARRLPQMLEEAFARSGLDFPVSNFRPRSATSMSLVLITTSSRT